MEFTKDIILNFKFRGLENIILFIKKFFLFLKKCTSFIISLIKRNKIITLSLSLLIVFIFADVILIHNFLKLFSTLY